MGVKRPSKRFSKEQIRQIEGRNPVREALRAGTPITKIFLEEQLKLDDRMHEILNLARQSEIKVEKVASKKLRQISKTAGHHQGIIAHAEETEEKNLKKLLDEIYESKREPFFVILAGVLYEHNLGAVIRTAESSGVDAVIVSNRAFGLTPVVSRTAVGAEEHIPLIHENLFFAVKLMKEQGIRILGASEKSGTLIYNAPLKKGVAIIMGAEDTGISESLDKLVDDYISIPMLGEIESLNMSVATALCLYEVVRQRKYS